MKKIRIGNTILAKWAITIDGEEVPLYDYDLSLKLYNPVGEALPMEFTIEDDNIIVFKYEGKDQTKLGKYRLTLYHNHDLEDQHVLDACDAFQLVSCTCKAEEGEYSNLELVVLELRGNISINGGGEAQGAVRYDIEQELSTEEKERARINIGVGQGGGITPEEVREIINEEAYQKSETDELLAAKQDTISDLSDIRTGASAGSTAVQPSDLPTFGDIVTHDADEFATATQGGKADTALQPSDIAEWAKQPTKPAYTASEVGALPDDTEIPSKTSDLTNDSGFIADAPSDNKQYARKNGAWSEVAGSDPEAVHFTPQALTEAQKAQARLNIDAALDSEWEKLCDLTTTEAVRSVSWQKGDDEQVFNDYNEIYIISLLQPSAESELRIRASLNGEAWSGRYLYEGSNVRKVPRETEQSCLCYDHFQKTPQGIICFSYKSYNYGSLNTLLQIVSNQAVLSNLASNQFILPSSLDSRILDTSFDSISIGSFTGAPISKDCRFIIYGKK